MTAASAALQRRLAVALGGDIYATEMLGLAGADATITGDITFTGTTGVNEIIVTDNLADALSIKWADGDFIVLVTTNSGEKIQLAQDVEIIAGKNLTFVGTTGQSELILTDNLADALSVKISGGADMMVFKTTDSAESLTLLSGATQKLAFFGATPVVQSSAFTQTYSTADKTVAAPTATVLTDSSGGATADGTIGAITTFTPSVAWNGSSVYPSAADATAIAAGITACKDAIKELATAINLLIADDLDNRKSITAIIDELQAYGLFS